MLADSRAGSVPELMRSRERGNSRKSWPIDRYYRSVLRTARVGAEESDNRTQPELYRACARFRARLAWSSSCCVTANRSYAVFCVQATGADIARNLITNVAQLFLRRLRTERRLPRFCCVENAVEHRKSNVHSHRPIPVRDDRIAYGRISHCTESPDIRKEQIALRLLIFLRRLRLTNRQRRDSQQDDDRRANPPSRDLSAETSQIFAKLILLTRPSWVARATEYRTRPRKKVTRHTPVTVRLRG
jgi:hypothetical protein